MGRRKSKRKSQPRVNNSVSDIATNALEINDTSNENQLDVIIKFINVLRNCPEENSAILEILSNIEKSANKKKCCEILKLLSDGVKNMNSNQIEYTERKLNDIIIPKILQNIWIFQNDFEISNVLLGSGAMSDVHLGKIKNQTPPKRVAIKIAEPGMENIILEEAKTMCKLKHPNILEIVGFTINSYTGILTEYMENLSLMKVLREIHPLKHLLKYILDVVNGLEYLVDKKYIHRDLCARNVFVNSSNICKIGDFGLCKYMGNLTSYSDEIKLITFYTAPEVKFSNTYSYASDIYSMGILIADIMHSPEILSDNLVLYFLSETQYITTSLHLPAKCPRKLSVLVHSCLERKPAKRPDIKQIKECVLQCIT